MNFDELLADISSMSTHQQVTLGIALAALLLSLYNIWHNRSLRRSEWLIASANTAAETLAIAEDTISLANDTKLFIGASFTLQGQQKNSRMAMYLDVVDGYRQTAENSKDFARRSLNRITSWWLPKLFVVHRLVKLAKAKHDVQTIHAVLVRMRTDFKTEQDRAQARNLEQRDKIRDAELDRLNRTARETPNSTDR